jgi:hypothetical protein
VLRSNGPIIIVPRLKAMTEIHNELLITFPQAFVFDAGNIHM